MRREIDEATLRRLMEGVGEDLTAKELIPLAELLSAAATHDRPTGTAGSGGAGVPAGSGVSAGSPGPSGSPGEEAAVAAFRAARNQAAADRRARPARPRTVRWRGRGAALGLALATLLGAGAAFAATGGLPLPGEQRQRAANGSPRELPQPPHPGASPGERTPFGSSGAPSGTPSPRGDRERSPYDPSGPAARAEARLDALCRAYGGLPAHRRASALRTPTFRPLVEAADGRAKVADHCAARMRDTHRPDPFDSWEQRESLPGTRPTLPAPGEGAGPGRDRPFPGDGRPGPDERPYRPGDGGRDPGDGAGRGPGPGRGGEHGRGPDSGHGGDRRGGDRRDSDGRGGDRRGGGHGRGEDGRGGDQRGGDGRGGGHGRGSGDGQRD
ncbi:hypothetical protein, partial [Streptomyces alkaliterrae]